MNKGRSTILFIITSIALSVTSSVAGSSSVKDVPSAFSINAISSLEECMEVLPGQVMDYTFHSSIPLDFNIHYHTENDIEYPVDKKNIHFLRGSLRPESYAFYTPDQEFFCVMWENNQLVKGDVSFSYRIIQDSNEHPQ